MAVLDYILLSVLSGVAVLGKQHEPMEEFVLKSFPKGTTKTTQVD